MSERETKMFAVRIDRDGDAYVFRAEPFSSLSRDEIIAIDSTPGIIAICLAEDPGRACARAWEKGEQEAEKLQALGGIRGLIGQDPARSI